MNIIAMHNMIRTLLDEHRTVRWDAPEIDDAINFVSKEIINSSISPEGRVVEKFEAVRKIRNELYPFLITNNALYPLDGEKIPIDLFPNDLRQLIRIQVTLLKSPVLVRAGEVVSVADNVITVVDAAVTSSDVGRYLKVRDGYYKITAVNAATPSITVQHNPIAAVVAGDAYQIYSGTELSLNEVNYITRNEYDSSILNDPFSKPRTDKYPMRIYYYIDSEGIKFKVGDTTSLIVGASIDYLINPATVVYGTEYGVNTSAGTALPAGALDYISVTESSITGTVYKENEEFTRNGGTVLYGIVVTGFTDSDFPAAMHEEIIKKTVSLISQIPLINTKGGNAQN